MATKDEICAWLDANPKYTKDRWGHYQRTKSNGQKIRFKMMDKVVRFERQVIMEATQYSPESKMWVKIAGNYYGNLYFVEDKEKNDGSKILAGMKRSY